MIRPALACLALAAPLAAQSVDAILAQHLKALGGPERLKKLQSIRLKGTLDLGRDGIFPLVIEAARPGRCRMESRAADGLVFLRLFDGERGWVTDDTAAVFTMTDRDAAAEKTEGFDGILAAGGCRFEFMERQEIAGRDAFRVKATRRDGLASTHWIDAATFLELQREDERDTPQGRRTFVTAYSDFRSVDGFPIPFRREISQRFSAKRKVIRIEQCSVNPGFPDSEFKLDPAH